MKGQAEMQDMNFERGSSKQIACVEIILFFHCLALNCRFFLKHLHVSVVLVAWKKKSFRGDHPMLLRAINPFCGKNIPPVNNPPSLANRVTCLCCGVFESMRKCLASLPLVGRVFAQVPVVVVTQKPSMKDSVCRVARNAIHASTQFVCAHKKAIACGLVLTGLATASYAIGTDSIQAAVKKSLDSLSTLYYGTPEVEQVGLGNSISTPIATILALGSVAAVGVGVVSKWQRGTPRSGVPTPTVGIGSGAPSTMERKGSQESVASDRSGASIPTAGKSSVGNDFVPLHRASSQEEIDANQGAVT
jgi:hypothetical protein